MTLEDKIKELYKDICKQMEEYQKACDDLYSDYYDLEQRINKVVMDLKLTIKFNGKDKNNCVLIDADHLEYIINFLKGETKDIKQFIQSKTEGGNE